MNSTPSVRASGPLSLTQHRLWFLDRFERDSVAHQVAWIFRLRGPLDVTRFRAALEAVIARHTILRTSFPEVDGQPVARVHPPDALACPLLDGAPASFAPAHFDLATGPLFSARLHRVADDEHHFLWNAHRIVFDEASLPVFARDLALAWRGELPAGEVAFTAFAENERAFLSGAEAASSLEFWKEYLAPPQSALQYPLDRPRPAVQAFASDRLSATLDGGFVWPLQQLAESKATDLPTVLLAAFAVLLHRHTHQSDLTIGLPILQHHHASDADRVGPLETIEVLRLAIDGSLSFSSFLEYVVAHCRRLKSQRGIPFERVLDAVQPERNLSYHPLFQAAFESRPALPSSLEFDAHLVADTESLPTGTAFDLSMRVAPARGAWQCTIEFNRDLFQQPTIARLLGHYRELLRSTAGDSHLNRLGILTAAEKRQLLVNWNATAFEHPADLRLHERFEQQAAETPEAAAAIFGSDSLSYRELNRRANQLAQHLRRQGVGPEMRVGLSMRRSFEMLVAILGILKTGAGYVPLDPAVPAERLHYMVEDAQLSTILTQQCFVETLAPHGVSLLAIDTEWSGIARESGTNPPTVPFADSLVYITYTSGSTGKPKGILMTQRPLLNLLGWMLRTTQLPPLARTLQFASLSFDVSFQDIFSTWLSGGTVVLITEAQRQDLTGLAGLLDRFAIHRLFLPAVALQQLAEGFCAGQFACASLRKIISGSEQLLITDAVRQMFTRLPQCRLHNEYGPSEAHVVTELKMPDDPATWGVRPAVGKPIDNTQMYILDQVGQPVPIGVIGELHIAGFSLARGYLGRAELTAEKFVPNPFAKEPGARMYRTGDQARWLPNGDIEFVGRVDHQIKIRGYRVEPTDVEAALEKHDKVREAFVMAREFGPGDKRLVAYLGLDLAAAPSVSELRAFLATKLPEYMIPSAFVLLEKLPLNANGKVDRKALPAPDSSRPELATAFVAPKGALEEFIAAQWRDLLRLNRVGARDNFFDLGGNSVMVVQIHHRLKHELQREIPLIALFQYPTVDTLAQFLAADAGQVKARHQAVFDRAARQSGASASPAEKAAKPRVEGIAIVGLAGRFPGARDARELWQNLAAGVERITRFSEAELLASGIPANLIRDPGYVPARATLDGADLFDASFFGFTPRDAELTDPQQRVFLECAWHALEDAALDPARFPGSVGVFAGSSLNTYLLDNIGSHRERLADFVAQFQADGYPLLIGSDKDYLATRVSYKLDLRGPSLTVQTACSTSLVAVVQAVGALLSHQCDAALAGGVSITFPQARGHLFQDGAILSKDGHCRAFDAAASGTVFGHGCGVVVLKRLSDAVRDNDHIYAVIKGAALNNDGAGKVSYTAPSVNGQADAIALAHALAGVTADTIDYVEAHGTATPLGDPIEVAALNQAFRATTDRHQFCKLGSVKTNFGHLEAAAGVTGLIKTALALEHAQIPPSLHFQKPNPQIDFSGSPFEVVTRLTPWERRAHPRRAGVSSFGVGGTNAHVVVEESPKSASVTAEPRPEVLLLSAKSAEALDSASTQLATHLHTHPDIPLASAAFTLEAGRRAFEHRRIVVAASATEAADALQKRPPKSVASQPQRATDPSVVFMFPGQGAQYSAMGLGLAAREPVFRANLDRCAEILQPLLGRDLREALRDTADLAQTEITQPALVAIEYATAQLWLARGVKPSAMIGHSVGEYVAAVLAEVMTLEDALRLVAGRARIVQALPPGAMLAARLTEDEAAALCTGDLSIAAANSPQLSVLSGTFSAIEIAEKQLATRGVAARRLCTSHAFHSPMMEPALAPFIDLLRNVSLREPRLPYISNVTGQWITTGQATDPQYWAGHVRQTVRFSAGVRELLKDGNRVLMEIGPGNTLAQLARHHGSAPAFPTLQDGDELHSDRMALGRLWLAGVEIDWAAVRGDEQPQRLSLPGYPFERQRHWIEPRRAPQSPVESLSAPQPPRDLPLVAAQASVESVILQQLEMMSRQLESLSHATTENGRP
jgi:amino acid adenylation domain-containing protein